MKKGDPIEVFKDSRWQRGTIEFRIEHGEPLGEYSIMLDQAGRVTSCICKMRELKTSWSEKMTSKTIKICDVCGKKDESRDPGRGWAHLSIHAGYGPHPFLTGPHAGPNDSASRDDDVCSAECAIKWFQTRIERVEANAKAWAEWNAGEKQRLEEQRKWREKDDAEYKARMDRERLAKEKEENERRARDEWVDAQRKKNAEESNP